MEILRETLFHGTKVTALVLEDLVGNTGPNTDYDYDTEVEVVQNYFLGAASSDNTTGIYVHGGECATDFASGVTIDSAAVSFVNNRHSSRSDNGQCTCFICQYWCS